AAQCLDALLTIRRAIRRRRTDLAPGDDARARDCGDGAGGILGLVAEGPERLLRLPELAIERLFGIAEPAADGVQEARPRARRRRLRSRRLRVRCGTLGRLLGLCRPAQHQEARE